MGIAPTAFIHPKAHVEECEIGARTRVWQFASVIRGTILGEDCNVASCATLDGPRFGNRCIVSQGVAMGPGFWIGDDVFIGPNVTICNDRWPAATKLDFDIGQFRSGLVAVFVHDGASIGANAVVLPGMTIGRGAVVAAGAVCNRSVPDDHLFGRDGKIVPIKTEWRRRRMFAA
jgi:UDP-2-acetamido-3-amino-2,3-dideoxy-glucuronate N-acetyltransferase